MKSKSFTHLTAALLVVVLLTAGSAWAKDDAGVPGGFLRFGASARSLALGNAVAGVGWLPGRVMMYSISPYSFTLAVLLSQPVSRRTP